MSTTIADKAGADSSDAPATRISHWIGGELVAGTSGRW